MNISWAFIIFLAIIYGILELWILLSTKGRIHLIVGVIFVLIPLLGFILTTSLLSHILR